MNEEVIKILNKINTDLTLVIEYYDKTNLEDMKFLLQIKQLVAEFIYYRINSKPVQLQESSMSKPFPSFEDVLCK